MSLLVAITLILFLLFGFSLIRKVAQTSSLPANFDRPNSVEPSTFRVVASSWYAPTAVMAVFVALSGVTNRELARFYSTNPSAAVDTSVDAIGAPAPTPRSQSDHQNQPVNDAPDWIHTGDQTNGDVRQVVLSSKLWSTAAEATAELQPIAAALVRGDFQERHKNDFDISNHRFLTDEVILHSAVKKRYFELIDQDFGAFSAPMYRLWLQVEISPVVRTELYPAWKSGAVGNRMIALGALIAILTLAANAITLFARLIRKSPHRWGRAVALVGTSCAAWIGAGLLLVTRLYF